MANKREVPEKTEAAKKGVCFVIAPIGDPGSNTRDRSDKVLKHVITPAAEAAGYSVIRADKIQKPGMITTDVIQHILDDPLVVADLTEQNPNVFYELAVRHATGKPVVQIIEVGEAIPFDIAQARTIRADHRDLDSVDEAKRMIGEQIKAVEDDPSREVDSPISGAIQLQSLRDSGNPVEESLAGILSMLKDLQTAVKGQQLQLEDQGIRVSRGLLGDRRDRTIDMLHGSLEGMAESLGEMSPLDLEVLQHSLARLLYRVRSQLAEGVVQTDPTSSVDAKRSG